MSAVIYSLCALTSLACFGLLLRSWLSSGHRLLFWSALCFGGLSINNILLVLDKLLIPTPLISWRLAVAFTSVLLLLIGLIWEEQ